jgi:L-iditol 2-dehydrogenase
VKSNLVGSRFYCDSPGQFSLKTESWFEENFPSHSLLKIITVGLCNSDYGRLFKGSAHKYPISLGHEIFAQRFVPVTEGESRNLCVFPLIPCKSCKSCLTNQYNLCSSYSYMGSREDGALSTYLKVPEWNILECPDNVDPFFIPMIEPISVVVHAFRKLPINSNRVVITGSGFLSYLAMKIAEMRKFSLIKIISKSKVNIELFEDRVIQNNDLLQERRFDSCLDFSGRSSSLEIALRLLEPQSRVVTVANSRTDTRISTEARERILRNEIDFVGSWNSTYGTADDDWSEALSVVQNLREFNYPVRQIGLSNLPDYLQSLAKSELRGERVHVDCQN